jgi:hypothetical protein
VPAAEIHGELQTLRERLAAAQSREAELRELLAEAHVALARRDEELVRSALAHRRVEEMSQTKIWRLGTRYWQIRDGVRGRLARRRDPEPR